MQSYLDATRDQGYLVLLSKAAVKVIEHNQRNKFKPMFAWRILFLVNLP
jgi:hypothetical protein